MDLPMKTAFQMLSHTKLRSLCNEIDLIMQSFLFLTFSVFLYIG